MRRLTLCLLLTLFGSAACAADQHAVSKQELLHHLAHDVMLPLTADFANAAAKLTAAGRSFCAGEADLRSAQEAWRAAQSSWQPLEMLQIGPAIERRSQRQLNFWPLRLKLLDPLLTGAGPVDPAQLETTGAAGKGLPALEYLLFTEDQNNVAPTKMLAATHCSALQALAAQVKTEADALATDWREPNGGFARQLAEAGRPAPDSPFASADQALSDVVNLLIAGLDAVKIRKLGKPLETSGAEVMLERIESWRAGATLDHIRDNLRGFELVFFGAGVGGIGLDDYLATIERPGLARVARQELQATRQALAAIRAPLQRALVTQRPQVESLHKGLSRLQHLMETEVADALQVDLGFNANDGD